MTDRFTRHAALLAFGGLAAMICLLAPVAAMIAVIRPMSYPNAGYVGMRPPSIAALWVDGCIRTTLVNRLNYESPDQPNDILRWYQAAGWLINFRYGDSVLRQTRENFGIAKVNSVKEIYVDRSGGITLIAAAMQYTVSVGAC